MFVNGLLATVDVSKLAEAHVSVFEAMNKTAFGRYICFDRSTFLSFIQKSAGM